MKRILVLEGDLRNPQVFCAILKSIRFRFLEATPGKEAIEISNNYESISLFVSGVSLSDLSGSEVALQIIQLQPDRPILIDWHERDQRKFRQVPPSTVGFLEKPFHASTLKAKVESLLRSHCLVSGD